MPKQIQPAPSELPSLDADALARVTGGAGMEMSTMLPMMMMMRGRSAQAAPTPAPAAPTTPKILVNGVEQPASALQRDANGAMKFEF